MPRRFHRRLAFALCALACAAVTVSLWTARRDVRTDDQNRDGRPDIWRVYDRQGQLATMAVDTNFDGRSDVHEYYERGALVRRESDRDFNDRVDLIQEFDATTRQALRSVSDVDFDGVADLLVLFQKGQPVYSRWSHGTPIVLSGFPVQPTSASPRGTSNQLGDHQLLPLDDPFRADLALSAIRLGIGFGDSVGLATCSGLTEPSCNVASPFASSSSLSDSRSTSSSSAAIVPYSPRGPPVSRLLS